MTTPNTDPLYTYLLVESDSARGQRLKAGRLRRYSVIDSWNHGSPRALLTWMEEGYPLYLGDNLLVRWERTGERDVYDAEVLRDPVIVARLWPSQGRKIRTLEAAMLEVKESRGAWSERTHTGRVPADHPRTFDWE